MPVWIRVRSELRSGWRAWLVLALLFGLAGGTAVVTGVIVAVDAAPAGARMTTATLRDDDGVDHVVRLPRELVPAAR
jgi:hypothetical protein